MAENDPDVQKLYEVADRKATAKYGRPAGLGIGGVLLLVLAFSNLDPSFFLQSYIRSHGVSAHGHVIDTTTYRIYDELTVKFSNVAGTNYEKTYNITPAAQG